MTGTPSASATIAVTRGDGGVGVFRAMTVLVDGRKAASVLTGNRAALEVPAGSHRVSARMDWARSPDLAVDVSGGAVAEIAVSFPLMSGLVNLVVHPHRAITITAVR